MEFSSLKMTDSSGTTQWLRTSQTACRVQDRQRSRRYISDIRQKIHSRFWQDTIQDGNGFVATAGDAHRERKVTCSNGDEKDAVYPKFGGVSGFVFGRRRFRKAQAPSTYLSNEKGPTDRTYYQCNPPRNKVRTDGVISRFRK